MSLFVNLSPFEKLSILFSKNLNFIVDPILKGQYNMDFDFSWVEKVNKQVDATLLRFYGWSPYCLSLGFNQKIDGINTDSIFNKKYDLVRRPTGGRAVFHSEEITYSCVVNLEEVNKKLIQNGFIEFSEQKYNHHDFYRDIHLFLIEVLSGINNVDGKIDYYKKDISFNSHYKTTSSVSCFSSSARYEITSQGKKIVGSAQRLFGTTLLQHGSILLSKEHLNIVDLLNLSSEQKVTLRHTLENSSISLSEIANKEITFEEVLNLVKKIKF